MPMTSWRKNVIQVPDPSSDIFHPMIENNEETEHSKTLPKIVLTRMMTTNYLLSGAEKANSNKNHGFTGEETSVVDGSLSQSSKTGTNLPCTNPTSKFKKNLSMEFPKGSINNLMRQKSPAEGKCSTKKGDSESTGTSTPQISPKAVPLQKHIKKCLKTAKSWVKKDVKKYLKAYKKEYHQKVDKKWFEASIDMFKNFKYVYLFSLSSKKHILNSCH